VASSRDLVAGSPHLRSERGQALVEFAFVLPLLAGLLLGIVQVGMVLSNYITLTDAARVGARKAIGVRLGGVTPTDAIQVVRDSADHLDQAELDVTITDPDWNAPGSEITVTASYPYSIDIPLLGLEVTSGTITATAKERLE
jgi:Flp pilus assembly protein TadG